MITRILATAIIAALLAFQVVRTAAVQRPGPRITLGARLWPSHPAVILDQTMADIGALARRGEELPDITLAQAGAIARGAPTAAEPFLIHGAVAQAAGQDDRSERLFIEARMRDPRSEAARYFLADRYLRTNRIAEALTEMAVFSRLVPTSSAQFAPALASFARTAGAVPQLRKFFRSSPEFEPLVLNELASDARNTDLIMSLARSNGTREPWQAKLVGKLVEQRQFAKAHAVWAGIAEVRSAPGTLFNPGFEKVAAPPPFNWDYSTRGGVAEPAVDGRLQVIYYGREDAVLAQQLLLLSPGRYRLAMEVAGRAGDGTAVAWSVTCLPQGQALISLPLKQGQPVVAEVFSVPPGCVAQRLVLAGSIGEFPQSIDFAIGKLSLTKAASQ